MNDQNVSGRNVAAANSTFAIGGDFCSKNPSHRKSANRYATLETFNNI